VSVDVTGEIKQHRCVATVFNEVEVKARLPRLLETIEYERVLDDECFGREQVREDVRKERL
jgi:hypothetical protein